MNHRNVCWSASTLPPPSITSTVVPSGEGLLCHNRIEILRVDFSVLIRVSSLDHLQQFGVFERHIFLYPFAASAFRNNGVRDTRHSGGAKPQRDATFEACNSALSVYCFTRENVLLAQCMVLLVPNTFSSSGRCGAHRS